MVSLGERHDFSHDAASDTVGSPETRAANVAPQAHETDMVVSAHACQ